ncbi:MAG: ABC transporter permease [Candidatus Eremiobacteraeota bacterium]|nr:ABC transporter permease [Candidatus Eremiobacteraeota bacterium]
MNRLAAYAGEALEAIWRHRVRSVLTMLGMIIGTASIIGVLGVSRAASGGIAATLASFGDPGIIIAVDPNQDDPQAAQIQYLDLAPLIESTRASVRRIVPLYNATYVLRANGISYETTVSSEDGEPNDTLTLLAGRRIDDDDVASAARVTLLSEPLYHRFFGNAPAIGRVMRIGGSRFRIIGVYNELKSSLLNTIAGGDYIEIPFSTFHEIRPGQVDFIQVFPRAGIAAASNDVIAELRRLHGPRAQYSTQDATAQLAGFNAVLGVIASGLTAIGGVALLVAGIGIMNIMLVSVTERTHEIGLRKAVGASRADIATQFLLEATLLSLIGGGIGMLVGVVCAIAARVALERLLGAAPIPYLLIISVAVGFSVFVGTVFGTYPALRAGRMDPVEALRQ